MLPSVQHRYIKQVSFFPKSPLSGVFWRSLSTFPYECPRVFVLTKGEALCCALVELSLPHIRVQVPAAVVPVVRPRVHSWEKPRVTVMQIFPPHFSRRERDGAHQADGTKIYRWKASAQAPSHQGDESPAEKEETGEETEDQEPPNTTRHTLPTEMRELVQASLPRHDCTRSGQICQ